MLKGVLIDIDGVLILDNLAIEGSVKKLNEIRKTLKVKLLTNTTCKSIADLHHLLINQGFEINATDIYSPPLAAIQILKEQKIQTIYPLFQQSLLPMFNDFRIDKENPEAVVIGDIGNVWNYDLLNRIFKIIKNGAEIIAFHKGKYWQVNNEPKLDIGLFVAGLEYTTNKTAIVVGKPSKHFFLSALEIMNFSTKETVMIGDDIENDIQGAQNIGIKGILVKTGKYKEADLLKSSTKPYLVLDSFRDFDFDNINKDAGKL